MCTLRSSLLVGACAGVCAVLACSPFGASDTAVSDGGPPLSDASVEAEVCDADVTSDEANCGACGHSCLGGGCIGGQCKPGTVLTGLAMPAGVALDATHLYYSLYEAGEIYSVERTRGAVPIKIASAVNSQAAHLALSNGNLYFAGSSSQTIFQIPVAGGKPTPIATCKGSCLGVAVYGTDLYFTDRGDSSVNVMALPNGTPHMVFDGLDFPEDLEVTATRIFVASEHADQVVVTGLDGGMQALLPIMDPVAVAIDGTYAWLSSQQGNAIWKSPLAGGDRVLVTASDGHPCGIAVDDHAVYWSNLDGGTIMVLAK